MSDVTEILSRIEKGDGCAAEELLPLVYAELKKLAAARMASERPDHTLQSTALVHEAYVRLVDANQVNAWNSRGHFFSAAAEAMRRILVESARAKKREKRGGKCARVSLENLDETNLGCADALLDLNDALDEFTKVDSEAAELVRLRLFAGRSIVDAGKLLGLSKHAAYKNWEYARVWFATQMK